MFTMGRHWEDIDRDLRSQGTAGEEFSVDCLRKGKDSTESEDYTIAQQLAGCPAGMPSFQTEVRKFCSSMSATGDLV